MFQSQKIIARASCIALESNACATESLFQSPGVTFVLDSEINLGDFSDFDIIPG